MLGELEAMSPEDRAVILGALTRRERNLLDRLGQTLVAQTPDGTGVSPWLAVHVHAARSGESTLTPATCEALLRAAGAPAREPSLAGRSLASAFGGLLAPRAAR
jgi:hypothetical protein